MHNTTTKDKVFQFILSILMVFFIGSFSGISQTNMTKIKDGTISGSSSVPNIGAILELESVNKGFLTPRLTTLQRDAISLANRKDGLLIFNTTTGCFNYWSKVQDNWLSICGTPPPAVIEISPSQCADIQVNGIYKQGENLSSSHFLNIPVTVTQAGTYEILATTNNGYYFSASGSFPAPGNYNVIATGVGTPSMGHAAGQGDALTITLNGVVSSCQKEISVVKANVSYTIQCGDINVLGTYMIAKQLDNSNKITMKVQVNSSGYWSIASNTVNGYSFRGSGYFDDTDTGLQEIVLLGSGAPVIAATDTFTFTTNSDTSSNCSTFQVTVQPLKYTVNCQLPNNIHGEYSQDEAMNMNNFVVIEVDVLSTGSTTISTNTVGGITFSSGVVHLSDLGVQEVVLSASGTPKVPGTHQFTLNSVPGMQSPCSFNLTVEAQPILYSLKCNSITVQGDYAPEVTMTSDNTMTIQVDVTYPGSYNISTNTVNGISFSKTGNFTTTGIQDVVLAASGTPIEGGLHRFEITSNSGLGTNSCSKNIQFVFNKIRVLGLGGGVYQPGSAKPEQSARAILLSPANFGPNGTVKSDGIEIFDGKYTQGQDVKRSINDNKIDVVVIGYNYLPDNETTAILESFVKNKKGVLIHSQENDDSSTERLINAIDFSGSTKASHVGMTHINPILNVDSPFLNGPFGDIRGKLTGSDVNNSFYVTGISSNFTPLIHQNNENSRYWFFHHNTLGYVFIGDSGWSAGNATLKDRFIWPAAITATGVPISKTYINANTTVYNSILYANTISWAIEYVQKNTNKNYIVEP